jgi:hypothetical protein
MGRPKLADSAKRQQTNFRLDPEDKERLERLAKERGQSVQAFTESLVVQGMNLLAHPVMSPELLAIFVAIMDQMQVVQSRNEGLPWHQDLTSWAACKMVFAHGPFARANPDDWRKVPQLDELWGAVTKARNAKQRAIELLKDMGVSVEQEKKTYPSRRGLFGHMNALLRDLDHRELERSRIEKIENDEDRQQAKTIFAMVERADAQEEAALDEWRKQLLPYIDGETEGETIYKHWRQEVVNRQFALGESPDWEDLV